MTIWNNFFFFSDFKFVKSQLLGLCVWGLLHIWEEVVPISLWCVIQFAQKKVVIFLGYHVGPTGPLSGAHFGHLTLFSTSPLNSIVIGPHPTYEAPTDMEIHNTTLFPWILQCDYHNSRCICLAKFRPNIVYVQGISCEQPNPIGLRFVTHV